MAPGLVFKFFGQSGKKTSHQATAAATTTRPPAGKQSGKFKNTALEARDLRAKYHKPPSPSPEPVSSSPCTVPSSPTFKFHPESARSSSPPCGEEWHEHDEDLTFNNMTSDTMPSKTKARSPAEKLEVIELEWANLEEAEAWIEKEQDVKLFSFASKGPVPTRGAPVGWTKAYVYVCSRGSSGGKKEYRKKFAWIRKKPFKSTGCRCRIRLTVFPDKVVGRYTAEHNHSLGMENARFTSISETTWHQIEAMLRSGVSVSNVLRHVHDQVYDERNRSQLQSGQSSRNHFVTRADVRRIEKAIEQETIRLEKQDGDHECAPSPYDLTSRNGPSVLLPPVSAHAHEQPLNLGLALDPPTDFLAILAQHPTGPSDTHCRPPRDPLTHAPKGTQGRTSTTTLKDDLRRKGRIGLDAQEMDQGRVQRVREGNRGT
ncbi:hypothetical protein DFP72DRAFT_1136120 [Ephemerocybe angulata]|uniref:FAR1 domain-containing protein n=1 Tax=Ephemerocybe angulata TaxID=980116 RepID=A0A8H6IGS5_9AGAR|nr:hypothetical protein DFP72DRAFT_1136120 [Tulosesus angulatus]